MGQAARIPDADAETRLGASVHPQTTNGMGLTSGPESPAIVREIDDPQSGVRWLLMRDANHPGGPGVLVRAGSTETAVLTKTSRSPEAAIEPPRKEREVAETVGEPTRVGLGRIKPANSQIPPVIRAGDSLILEENSAVVEARLEATALGPAAIGSPLAVRLKIGGKVVQAVALGSGRVAFRSDSEVHP